MPIPTLVYERDVGVTEAAAARRERVLSQLATSAAPRAYRIAFDLLRDRAGAEDAVQEALARACESAHRLRDPDAVEAWFFRVLTNLCMRILRRRRWRVLLGGARSPGVDVEAAVDAAVDAADRASNGSDARGSDRADVALSRREEIHHLLGQLDTLPAQQRVALVLRYGHERSIAEIADMLEVKPATVKTHLVRGLRRLRRSMERLS
ncbi:RNA polymerase sigma factor [Haliangium sp.]|uniref:RNA polymerase sigma factor n=1 Tax=Haliangium sp. TaxID=2663208 RepID=UPI003D0C56C5